MNRIHLILLISLGFTFAIVGCTEKGTNNPDGDTDSLSTDSIDYSEMEYIPTEHSGEECASLAPYEFCFNGMSFIQLTDTLSWVDLAIPGGVLKDTVFQEIQFSEAGPDTVAWTVRMISEAEGKVYLESDFETNWTLNRVRVESPKYVLKPYDVRVGMTIGELKTKFPNLYVGPLPDFGMLEIYPSGNLFFLVKDKDYLKDVNGIPSIASVPDDAVIESIVIM